MKPIFNRAPLTPNTLSALPLGAIRPEGWLYDELRMQMDGITKDFAAVCPEFTESGEWKAGADGDLTRSMYYLEALVHLAWTMDDDALKARVGLHIDWLIASQREDGWFGPADNDDYWPLMLALRVLRAQFSAGNDKRILVLMDRFFKYEYKRLAEHPLRDWAVARGAENMEIALWLYSITGQKYLLGLCQKLRAQTIDWANFFHTFSNVVPMNKTQRWERLREALHEEADEPLMGERRPYFHSQFHQTQGVNLAMGLKAPGVVNLFKSGFKEQGGFHFGYEKLMKYHGMANGMFSCDAHINGSNPVQGVSLQAVVEMLNSMSSLIGIGDFGAEPADVFEKIAYNALPAAFSADMRRYQRVQQANQVSLSKAARRWYNAGDAANLYRCAHNDLDCASAQQAWARVAEAQWYATNDGGLAAISYAPCAVRAVLDGTPVRLSVSGGYPFFQQAQIRISAKAPAEFPLYLRIPFWARQSMIYLPDGEIMQVRSGESACVRRRWINGDVIRIEMPASPRISRWYHQSGAVEVGPLLMALRLEPEWAETPDGRCARSKDPWNRALVRDAPMKLIQIAEDVSAFGHGDHSCGVLVKAAKVDWPMDGADCAAVPMASRFAKSAVEVLELIPYGEAPLRICEFPMGSLNEEKQKELK